MTNWAVKVNELEGTMDKLHGSSLKFAGNIISYAKRNGAPSPGQQPYVQKLINQAKGLITPTPRETEEVGSMMGLIALFSKAKQHLKFPKISLQVNGNPVRLAMGIRGAGAGCVNVTDGGPYENNRWYGRVSPQGTWTKGRHFPEANDVRELLKEMAADPARTAQAYGRLTGNCCFCNKTLTDAKSTDVGYGPVCADHYGLPWGKKGRG